jgi:hypothetical protein
MAKNIGFLKPVPESKPVLVGKLKYPIRKRKKQYLSEEFLRNFGQTNTIPIPETPIQEPAVQELPAQRFTFNITMPSIEVNIPTNPAPNVIVNNEVQPTPINVMPSEVVVTPPIISPPTINVMPSEVVVNPTPVSVNVQPATVTVVPAEAPVVNVRNIIKMQPENNPMDFKVKRDELGNIIGIEES